MSKRDEVSRIVRMLRVHARLFRTCTTHLEVALALDAEADAIERRQHMQEQYDDGQ